MKVGVSAAMVLFYSYRNKLLAGCYTMNIYILFIYNINIQDFAK